MPAWPLESLSAEGAMRQDLAAVKRRIECGQFLRKRQARVPDGLDQQVGILGRHFDWLFDSKASRSSYRRRNSYSQTVAPLLDSRNCALRHDYSPMSQRVCRLQAECQ
jgi:hypothetical protein